MDSINGLHLALTLYSSDKIKDRSLGLQKVTDIFSDEENLLIFQAAAVKEGGAAWIAVFHILFRVVITEKRSLLKKETAVQAERLSQSIRLVRLVAEQAVFLIAKKPFLALLTHMRQQLVLYSNIYDPPLLDYSKAIRKLLSYPPHLESVDANSWLSLMSICFAAILGGSVASDDSVDGEDPLGISEELDLVEIEDREQASQTLTRKKLPISQASADLVQIIPTLLCSTHAPIYPPVLREGDTLAPGQKVGLGIILKICRFMALHPQITTCHLPLLRAANIVLSKLELNSRKMFLFATARLFPHLVSLWALPERDRDRRIPEETAIAIRTMLPYVTHKDVMFKDQTNLRVDVERLMSVLARESVMSRGIDTLDLNRLRLRTPVGERSNLGPYETSTFTAGHHFSVDQAFTWISLEIYGDCCLYLHLHKIYSPPTPSTYRQDGSRSKRRKVEDALASLIAVTNSGKPTARLLALQTLFFVVDKHWIKLSLESRSDIHTALTCVLGDDNQHIQSWAYIVLSSIAISCRRVVPGTAKQADPPPPRMGPIVDKYHWAPVWNNAMGKCFGSLTCRASCHAASVLLQSDLLDDTTTISGIQAMLQTIEIQGPAVPHDSVCDIISTALEKSRTDIKLYCLGLDDKVITWLEKIFAAERNTEDDRDNQRLEQNSPACLLRLLSVVSGIQHYPLVDAATVEFLPDSAVVKHVIQEFKCRPIRDFLLHQIYPKQREPVGIGREDEPTKTSIVALETSMVLDGRPRRLSNVLLGSLEAASTVTSLDERSRRFLDLAVLGISFQGTLLLNNYSPHTACINTATRLLHKLQPYFIPSKHKPLSCLDLMWRGLRYLTEVPQVLVEDGDWPILVRPGLQSGIRQDHLNPSMYDIPYQGSGEKNPSENQQQNGQLSQIPATFPSTFPPKSLEAFATSSSPSTSSELLVSTIWQLPTVATGLKEFFSLALVVIDPANASEVDEAKVAHDDDDDEFDVEESDSNAITLPGIAETNFSTSAMTSAIKFRLKGAMLAHGHLRAYKDTQLVNSFLRATGPKAIAIGLSLCEAAQTGWLRLGVDAVDCIISTLGDMLNSYGYSRDEGAFELCIEFLQCSLPIWVEGNNDLVEEAMRFVHYFATKISSGGISSGKIKVTFLRFVDRFLHYEEASLIWSSFLDGENEDDEMNIENRNISTYMSKALLDSDMQVRMRAASSAAAIFYRSALPAAKHSEFFSRTCDLQPHDHAQFDVYVSHLLWKLNCCIASAGQRPTAIFHLQEVTVESKEYNTYLEAGFVAVAQQLGLPSFSTLYSFYSPIICLSKPEDTSFSVFTSAADRLFGFENRQEFFSACLEFAGTHMLLGGNPDLFRSACTVIGVSPEEMVLQNFAPIAAVAIALAFKDVSMEPGNLERFADIDEALAALARFPGMTEEGAVERQVKHTVNGIGASLWELIDLESSINDVSNFLEEAKGEQESRTFRSLMKGDPSQTDTVQVTEPRDSIQNVFAAYNYLCTQYSTASSKIITYGAIRRLTYLINNALLVSEQRRYLRALALLIAINEREVTSPPIFDTLVKELLAMLSQPDICQAVISMIRFMTDQLASVATKLSSPALINLFVRLGSVKYELTPLVTSGAVSEALDALEDWIVQSTPRWMKSKAGLAALQTASLVWPNTLRERLNTISSPSPLQELCDLSQGTAAGIDVDVHLCRQLLHLAKAGAEPVITAFKQSIFWSMKSRVYKHHDSEGTRAFQDLLYLAGGQIDEISAEGGLAGSMKKQNQKNKNPHVAIIQRVYLLLNSPRYQIRATAYRALQGIKDDVKELGLNAWLPREVSDLLDTLEARHIASSSIDDERDLQEYLTNGAWRQCFASTETWALSLLQTLCRVASKTDRVYGSLDPLLSTHGIPIFDLLPPLVHGVLTCNVAHKELLSRSQAIADHFTAVLQSQDTPIETVQSILQVILYLRDYEPPYNSGILGYNAWFNLRYIDLSSAAVKCGSYVTALLFVELAIDQKGQDGVDLGNDIVRKNMYEIYHNVEDPDGFYGIQNHNVKDALRRRLDHEGLSWQALGWSGAAFNCGDQSSNISVLHNLHDIGFSRLASVVASQTYAGGSSRDDPLFAELSWRTGMWEVPLTEDASKTSSGLLHAALGAIHGAKDPRTALEVVDRVTDSEMERLRNLPIEMMTSIKEKATNLLCLRELSSWLEPQVLHDLQDEDLDTSARASVLDDFRKVDDNIDFGVAERVISTRLSLFTSLKQREQHSLIGDQMSQTMELVQQAEIACHLRLSEIALKANNLQTAVNSLTALQGMEANGYREDDIQDMFCKTLWKQGEHILAIQLVEDLVGEAKLRGQKDKRLPVLRGRLAHWTSQARLKPAAEIFSTFIEAAHAAASSKIDPQEFAEIQYQLACFADREYSVLLNSPELKRLESLQEIRSNSQTRITGSQILADILEDDRALTQLQVDKQMYLTASLKAYVKCITISDRFDDCITRLVNLWFENEQNAASNETFSRIIVHVPSHKFIFLGPQLTARLHRPEKPHQFNATLNKLVLRICRDHPFHILYQVITLGHDYAMSFSSSFGRGPAAAEIMSVLLASSGSKHTLEGRAAVSMSAFVRYAIEWTKYLKPEQRSGIKSPQDVPQNASILRTPKDIPIATRPPPVDISCKYEGIATLSRYDTKFSVAGGISKPLILACYDTNGEKFKQIFKVDDAFRQDAVMEQVFVLVNDLLNRNREARTRNLRFRTYGVLALPESTGVIEFVLGTTAIGTWLEPAHVKYHPSDWKPRKIREMMNALQHSDKSKQQRPKQTEIARKYTEYKQHFKPVMRHFFTEKHRDPMAWFSMRLAYGRSLAVSSIVGWLLGIGDRHCSNVLIDQRTGEVVHIDFGVAFEAGRYLRIPELVPFRLTDDLVDALGITGVNGTFRQCSQIVLQILIESSDIIMTILEVFQQDPLHTWDTTEKKKRQRGAPALLAEGDVSKGREKADRILRKVREKLSKDLSVQYRVNQLIQEARDVNHLAMIYVGWAPWL